jgi:hypothetical protein
LHRTFALGSGVSAAIKSKIDVEVRVAVEINYHPNEMNYHRANTRRRKSGEKNLTVMSVSFDRQFIAMHAPRFPIPLRIGVACSVMDISHFNSPI